MVWDKMSNPYRGPSIDAFYQVSVHLAKQFRRRRLKCERLADDGRQGMANTHMVTHQLGVNSGAPELFLLH